MVERSMQTMNEQTETDNQKQIGAYRIRAVPPQQFELQQKRPKGDWRGVSWCTSFESAGLVLLRRVMAEQSTPCKSIADLIEAVNEAQESIAQMLKSEMQAANPEAWF